MSEPRQKRPKLQRADPDAMDDDEGPAYTLDGSVRQALVESQLQVPSEVLGRLSLLNSSARFEPALFQSVFDLTRNGIKILVEPLPDDGGLGNARRVDAWGARKVRPRSRPGTSIFLVEQLKTADATTLVAGQEDLRAITEILRLGYFPSMRHLRVTLPEDPDIESFGKFLAALASRSAQIQSLFLLEYSALWDNLDFTDAPRLDYAFDWSRLTALRASETMLTVLGVTTIEDPVVVFPALTYLNLQLDAESTRLDEEFMAARDGASITRFRSRLAVIAPAVTHFAITVNPENMYESHPDNPDDDIEWLFGVDEYRFPNRIQSFAVAIKGEDHWAWHADILRSMIENLRASGVCRNIQTLSLRALLDGDTLPLAGLDRKEWPALRKLRVTADPKFAGLVEPWPDKTLACVCAIPAFDRGFLEQKQAIVGLLAIIASKTAAVVARVAGNRDYRDDVRILALTNRVDRDTAQMIVFDNLQRSWGAVFNTEVLLINELASRPVFPLDRIE